MESIKLNCFIYYYYFLYGLKNRSIINSLVILVMHFNKLSNHNLPRDIARTIS